MVVCAETDKKGACHMYKKLVQFFKKIFEPDKNGPTAQDLWDAYFLKNLILRKFPKNPLYFKNRKNRKNRKKRGKKNT